MLIFRLINIVLDTKLKELKVNCIELELMAFAKFLFLVLMIRYISDISSFAYLHISLKI